MTRQFTKVAPAVWGSRRFVALPTAEAKLAYMYFLSNEHSNSAGAYRIREGYALADLGWTAEVYAECIANLVQADLIAYDEETEEVFVRRWYRHNPPMNEKHAQGCNRIILALDSQVIAETAMEEFEEANRQRTPPAPAYGSGGNVSPALREQLAASKAANGGGRPF